MYSCLIEVLREQEMHRAGKQGYATLAFVFFLYDSLPLPFCLILDIISLMLD